MLTDDQGIAFTMYTSGFQLGSMVFNTMYTSGFQQKGREQFLHLLYSSFRWGYWVTVGCYLSFAEQNRSKTTDLHSHSSENRNKVKTESASHFYASQTLLFFKYQCQQCLFLNCWNMMQDSFSMAKKQVET